MFLKQEINSLEESIAFIYKTNNVDNQIRYNIEHSYYSIEFYYKILQEVLKLEERPKRIIDIGSNLNQFGYLFANIGIEYIGIDNSTGKYAKPIQNDMIKFINASYSDVKEEFKEDIIISCLCVGYQIPIEDVDAKVLIINGLDENRQPQAKVIRKENINKR